MCLGQMWDYSVFGADMWDYSVFGADMWDNSVFGADMWDYSVFGADMWDNSVFGALSGVTAAHWWGKRAQLAGVKWCQLARHMGN